MRPTKPFRTLTRRVLLATGAAVLAVTAPPAAAQDVAPAARQRAWPQTDFDRLVTNHVNGKGEEAYPAIRGHRRDAGRQYRRQAVVRDLA